jgi:hypothetical protein
MSIYYLDIDDEITAAAARIRDSADSRIALVVQGGSRIATSRMNFRLLEREAHHHNRRLAIIAADPSVRSLAQTAGLPVYSSVGEFQKADAAAAGQPGGADEVSETLGGLAASVDVAAARAVGAGPARLGPGNEPVRRVRPGGSGALPIAGRRRLVLSRWMGVALVAVLVVAGVAGFVLVPSARIVLTLRTSELGPMAMSVKVDPAVTSADDTTLTVPALSRTFDLAASGTFQATGQEVVETAATGTVTFTNGNTGQSVTVQVGTKLTTASGLAFTTTAAVTVPRATLSGTNTVTFGRADAPVVAVKKGLSGNVAAHAIVDVPASLAKALVVTDQVTNSAPTSGGTHIVNVIIQQSDIDAAEASLKGDLDSSLQSTVADQSSGSADVQLFPQTARLGVPTFKPDPATLLNTTATSFGLDADATGSATGANVAGVRLVADHKFRSSVKTGYSLVEGSVRISLGAPAGEAGSVVSVPVLVTGLQAPTVDVDALKAAIKGKSASEVKAALAKYGDTQVSFSPFWTSTVPGFEFRIDIEVIAPSPLPTPTPRPSLEPVRTPAPATPTPGTPEPSATPGPTETPAPGPTDTPSPSPTPEPTPSIQASPSAT